MSRELVSVDFKLSRLTRLFIGTEMTKGKEADTAAVPPTADQETVRQTAAETGRGSSKPAVSQASKDLMKSFLGGKNQKRGREDWAASPKSDQAAKRAPARQEEEEVVLEDLEDTEEEEDEAWQAQLRRTMMEAAGLTPEQANICMRHIKKTFKERVAEEAKRIAKKVFKDEVEVAKCRRSILMHNADRWVAPDVYTQGYSLAERVTAAVQRTCGGMVTVVDCFAVGGWQEGRQPSSVYLSFGSAQQKTTFFKIMANRIRFGNEAQQNIRVLACRDAFPKDYIMDAKKLAQKGMSLKREGLIASFRVVARGLGCIPVLETRARTAGGQPAARWMVYQDQEGDKICLLYTSPSPRD